MNKKILLVDDEKDIVEFLSYNLRKEAFQVFIAYNGDEALRQLSNNPDLIILDIMMPKKDGFEVYKEIRRRNGFEKIPIIFLTAKTSELNEITGLDLGASDYIHKPISPNKLIARVKANLRKVTAEKLSEKPVLKHGPILVDREKYIVLVDQEEKIFPKKEFELLCYLLMHVGKVVIRENILIDVWGTSVYVGDRTIDVHIRKIREKLGNYSEFIETIKGVGYRFKEIN